jgi:cyclohexadienyl dehydratase
MFRERHPDRAGGFQVLEIIRYFISVRRLDHVEFHYAIVFSLIFFVLGCEAARTSPTKSVSTPPREILRVATSGDYSPFSDWPEDAPAPRGFSVSVAEAYARATGVTLEWSRFRWPELADDLATGSFDLALSGITIRPDRSILGRFGLPLTISGAIVLVPANSPLESTRDLDRSSIRIAVNAGGHLERVTRHLFPAAHIEAIADNAAVLGSLAGGAADAVVTDTLEAPHWKSRAGAELRMIGPLTRDLKAAWFPPENEPEALHFNRWLLQAESAGQLDPLRRKYGLPEERTARPLAALLSSLDERLTLMPAVADAKQILGAAIENPAREEIVLDAAIRAVQDATLQSGIAPPDAFMVRRLFRAQIEAAKWIQVQHLENAPAEFEATTPAERLDAQRTLDETIRPALIYLGKRISMLLIACVAESRENLAYADVARALDRHDLPESSLRALYEALSEIITPERRAEPTHRPSAARTSKASSGSMQKAHP